MLSGGNGANIQMISGSSGYSYINFGDVDDDNDGRIAFDFSNQKMEFWTNKSQQITIDGSGQLGIGTASPSADLDVEGTFQLVDGNESDGSVLTSDASGNATWSSNITSAVNAGNGLNYDATDDEIQLGGTLSEATTIAQGAYSLDFTTSAVDGFSVDGTTFSVDGSNDYVGIGTASPSTSLDVVGNTELTGDLDMTGDAAITGNFQLVDGNETAGSVLTGDASGNATWSSNVASAVDAGNGLNYDATADEIQLGGFLSENTAVILGSFTLDFATTATDGFSVDGTTFSVDGSNNYVGIGTASPSASLDVVGNTELTGDFDMTGDATLTGGLDMTGDATLTGDFDMTGDAAITGNLQLVDGNEASGSVLTGDASGNASWSSNVASAVDAGNGLNYDANG